MKTKNKNKDMSVGKKSTHLVDETYPDTDADKTGTDMDSDCTKKRKGINKFDKPKREPNPDTTSTEVIQPKPKRKILK